MSVPSDPARPLSAQLPPWLSGAPYPPWILVSDDQCTWTLEIRRTAVSDETIDFRRMVSGPSKLAEHDRDHLMQSAMWVIWRLGTEPIRAVVLKPSTLASVVHYLGQSTAWLVAEGFSRWTDLTLGDVARLKAHLYHLDRSRPPPGSESRARALGILNDIHILWRRGAIPDGLTVDPRVNDRACVRSVLAAYRQIDPSHIDPAPGSTRSMPWPVAQVLCKAALDLVEYPLIVSVKSMAAELRLARYDSSGVRRSPSDGGQEEWKVFRRWRKRAPSDAVIAAFALENPKDFKDLFEDVLTSCFILTGVFGALRLEENASLPVRKTTEERNDGHWMAALLCKTSPELDGTVIPLPVPLIAVKAIELARSATAAYRTDQKELFIFETRGEVWTLCSMQATRLLGRFAARRCTAVAEAVVFPFCMRQFRKLFVQLLVRRFDGSPEAAQQHLRHLSQEQIEAYTSDPELVQLIAAEQQEVAAEVMLSIMTGMEPTVGKPAERWRAFGRLQGRVVTKRQADELVRREGVLLEPNGIGYCLRRGFTAPAAACGLTSDGLPDQANASSSACTVCARSLTTSRQAPLLQALYVSHKSMVDSPDAAAPLKAASEKQCRLIARRLKMLDAGGSQDDQ